MKKTTLIDYLPKESCDQKCRERHPRECKYRERCKFKKKDICAFSHVYNEAVAEKPENNAKI